MAQIRQTSESAASNKKQATRKKATGMRKTAAKKIPSTVVTPDERHRLIAETAFLKAERRSFQGGDPVEDWLKAETEVDNSLTN